MWLRAHAVCALAPMARRLRIQYPGAMYHVTNRGNYRRDVFETAGAAAAFEKTLDECCQRHDWQLHACALMRNHFHLALETPKPDLADGMHWLQSTYAVRFNRFRSEQGHLFQGRYQSFLIEDDAALLRVADYIHLNPVLAGIVAPDQVERFRWSSLTRFIKGPRWPSLTAARWLGQLGLEDSATGWTSYVHELVRLARDPAEQERRGFGEFCRGWAIGTAGWKRTLAREYAHLATIPEYPESERRDIRQAHWQATLEEALGHWRKSADDLLRAPKYQRWKVEIAARLRTRGGAPYRWIAAALKMGTPGALRVAVCRLANM
jgi:putative transposase